MKLNAYPGLALAALAALALAGCATTERPQAAGASPQAQGPAPAVAGIYRLPGAADKNRGKGQPFYLVRAGDQWRVSFDTDEFKRSGGERLVYWPNGKMVAMAFDRVETTDANVMLCDDKTRDRQKQGYTICTSAFRTKDRSALVNTARVLAGLSSGGLSEIVSAQTGRQFETIDMRPVFAVLERDDLDRQFWLKDYHERAAAQNVSGLTDFVRRYEHDDPDQLVGKARAQLATLAQNARMFDQAERGTPQLAQYRHRFMPANPQKYCAAFKGDAEDYKICLADASSIVAALAEQRATAARRIDMCLSVSKALGAGRQAPDCQTYGAGYCHAGAAQGQQVCDILNRKGQS